MRQLEEPIAAYFYMTTCTCIFISLSLSLSLGELQSILCAVYTSSDIVYTGTLSGDLYKWKGHTLQSTIKGAHKVNHPEVPHDNQINLNDDTYMYM